MFEKIKEIQNSGFLLEFLGFTFNKKLRKLLNQSYRFCVKWRKKKIFDELDVKND
jgi:hypothetical protein